MGEKAEVTESSTLVATHWCVECWPKKEWAFFIFNGRSYCEEHFCLGHPKPDRKI